MLSHADADADANQSENVKSSLSLLNASSPLRPDNRKGSCKLVSSLRVFVFAVTVRPRPSNLLISNATAAIGVHKGPGDE